MSNTLHMGLPIIKKQDVKQEYISFLSNKKHSIGSSGFDPLYIPSMAFDFQKEIIERALRKGRIAIFADTGLGKTLIMYTKQQRES